MMQLESLVCNVDNDHCVLLQTPSLVISWLPRESAVSCSTWREPLPCAPCVILLPPDFLRGSCSQHPANYIYGKRERLYKMFWRLLSDLGVWGDEGYLIRKEARTTAHKRCEMLPRCVITVSMQIVYAVHYSSYMRWIPSWVSKICRNPWRTCTICHMAI
jgi:hypothetical protein